MEWTPIQGLTDDANTLMAENWSILEILEDPGLSPADRDQLFDMLSKIETRFQNLGDKKYR